MQHHLAEFNVARLHEPLDAPASADFVAALDAVNLLAESSPGFVWRLQDDSGASSSYVVAYDDPLMIINLSVWQSLESLRHFVYQSGHRAYLRRRREWFEPSTGPSLVCWWLPAGQRPTVAEAMARLQRLGTEGPGGHGFGFAEAMPPPHG